MIQKKINIVSRVNPNPKKNATTPYTRVTKG